VALLVGSLAGDRASALGALVLLAAGLAGRAVFAQIVRRKSAARQT